LSTRSILFSVRARPCGRTARRRADVLVVPLIAGYLPRPSAGHARHASSPRPLRVRPARPVRPVADALKLLIKEDLIPITPTSLSSGSPLPFRDRCTHFDVPSRLGTHGFSSPRTSTAASLRRPASAAPPFGSVPAAGLPTIIIRSSASLSQHGAAHQL